MRRGANQNNRTMIRGGGGGFWVHVLLSAQTRTFRLAVSGWRRLAVGGCLGVVLNKKKTGLLKDTPDFPLCNKTKKRSCSVTLRSDIGTAPRNWAQRARKKHGTAEQWAHKNCEFIENTLRYPATTVNSSSVGAAGDGNSTWRCLDRALFWREGGGGS